MGIREQYVAEVENNLREHTKLPPDALRLMTEFLDLARYDSDRADALQEAIVDLDMARDHTQGLVEDLQRQERKAERLAFIQRTKPPLSPRRDVHFFRLKIAVRVAEVNLQTYQINKMRTFLLDVMCGGILNVRASDVRMVLSSHSVSGSETLQPETEEMPADDSEMLDIDTEEMPEPDTPPSHKRKWRQMHERKSSDGKAPRKKLTCKNIGRKGPCIIHK